MNALLRYGAPLVLLALAGGCATTGDQAANAHAVLPASQSRGDTAPSIEAARSNAAPVPQSLNTKAAPRDRSVYYDYDKTEAKAGGVKVIEANAQYLRDHPDIKVRVEGNADERGSREYNLALGQRRAEGIAMQMELLGVPEQHIEAVSYGAEKPKSTRHDEQSWAENRRSDIDY